LIELRHDIHKYPEIRWTEFKTSEKVYNYLTNKLNINPNNIKKIAKTGLIINIKGKAKEKGDNFILALRADMDALPMKENNPHLDY
jgi:metal-dependent amidase/aminoacylase/carboxypeptidase family protein